MDRLRGEELMAQVDGDAIVPVVDCHVLRPVALVVGRVVHKRRDRTKLVTHAADHRLQRGDIAEVAALIARRALSGRSYAFDQCDRRGIVDVDEHDLRVLRAKMLYDRRADPGAAAGDEHNLACEARIAREAARCGLRIGQACAPFGTTTRRVIIADIEDASGSPPTPAARDKRRL